MTNLYHLKSDHDREDIGDVIINLDKVLTIGAIEKDNKFGLVLFYRETDNAKAWFKDKEVFLSTFKEILSRMGADEKMVDEYVIQIPEDKQKKMAELFERITEFMGFKYLSIW
jgi:hypothetical protein